MQLGKQIQEQESNPNKSYFDKVALVESGGNSNAKNPYSSAGGKYQFIDSTWKAVVDKYNLGYSLQDKYNPVKAQVVMEHHTKDNKKQLEKSLGYTPNDGELYLAHFLGAGGAGSFIKTVNQEPNKLATEHFSEGELKANRNVFFNKNGTPKTLSQVYEMMTNKVGAQTTNQPQEEQTVEQIFFTFTPKPNMTGVNLGELVPEEEKTKEQKEIEEADKALELEDRKLKLFEQFNNRRIPQQQEEEVAQQIVQTPDFNALETYQQIDQFVSNPIMQQGGQIPSTPLGQYQYPNQVVNIPTNGSITMQGVNYPLLGISQETGQRQVMFPNQEYFFKNTQNVVEVPLDFLRPQ